MASNEKYYSAFLSYREVDYKTAKWLQRRLEHYTIPKDIRNKFNYPKKIKPIFEYKSEMAGGYLRPEIKKALSDSDYLIVICSRATPESPWVADEINYFIELGGTDHIIPFITSGEAFANDPAMECFPEPLLKMPEPLRGIHVNELGRKAAAVKVIAKMLGIKFNDLWKRHQRTRKLSLLRNLSLLAFIGLIIAAFWYHNLPFDAEIYVTLDERSQSLAPPTGISIKIETPEDTITDTINLKQTTILHHLPAHFKGKGMKILAQHPECLTLDTIIKINQRHELVIHRNPDYYGHIDVGICYSYNNPARGIQVLIDGEPYATDKDGRLRADIPLARQKKKYTITYQGKKFELNMPSIQTDVIQIDK